MGQHTNFYYPAVPGYAITDQDLIDWNLEKFHEDMRFYDSFRVSIDHNETFLRNLEQTIYFLSKGYHSFSGDYEDEDIPELDVILRSKIELFWKDHPDGFISFG